MLLDLTPLKNNREFRYLYLGQIVSLFGTMMSLGALPYQIYHLTNSTWAVGLLGVIGLAHPHLWLVRLVYVISAILSAFGGVYIGASRRAKTSYDTVC